MGRAGRALASLLSGLESWELDVEAEAAGILLAQTFSMARRYMSGGKVE